MGTRSVATTCGSGGMGVGTAAGASGSGSGEGWGRRGYTVYGKSEGVHAQHGTSRPSTKSVEPSSRVQTTPNTSQAASGPVVACGEGGEG